MKKSQNGFLVFLVSLSILYGLWEDTAAQQQPAESNVLSIAEKVQAVYWAPWTRSAITYRNAVELVVLRKTRIIGKEDKKEREVEYPEARCLITVEPRTSHADALKGLAEIASERDGSVRYLEIASWPGLELTFIEELQRRGKNPPSPSSAQRAITAVAAGDKLLRFEISLVPNADSGLLRDAQNIARDVRVQERGNPAAVKQELEKLNAAREGKTREKRATKTPAAPRPSNTVEIPKP